MSMATSRVRSAIDSVEDIEPEETEYNVKEMLQKQKTYGLFCPDCNSHITGRVILRKRRSNVPRFHPPGILILQSASSGPIILAVPYTLKSIVYGGLIESIASLVVVSSAAGAGTSTLSTLALSLANLIGGLFILIHCLRELGRRENFCRRATVAVIAFLVFGSVAPITYGFSFHETDDRGHKLAAVAAASLPCILLLALGKARVHSKSYLETALYYLVMGFAASGASFLVGMLVDKSLERCGLFKSGSS